LAWRNEKTDIEEYGWVIKEAYRIEECFSYKKKCECGLADYQVRNGRGWHHHVTLSMLSLWFLVSEVRRQKKAYQWWPLQQVRECLSAILAEERWQQYSLDEYICYKCIQQLNRTKLTVKYYKNKKK
jgi:hypothetical protein